MKKLEEGGLSPEEERNNKIKKKITVYKKIFKEIDKNKKSFVDSMISQLSYIEVALDELQGECNREGYVDKFEQGSQKFIREHPAAKSYNSFVKSYNSIMKTLLEYVPVAVVMDDMQKFLKGKKK